MNHFGRISVTDICLLGDHNGDVLEEHGSGLKTIQKLILEMCMVHGLKIWLLSFPDCFMLLSRFES